MGTAIHSLPFRTDNKLYRFGPFATMFHSRISPTALGVDMFHYVSFLLRCRLNTPQRPLVRTQAQTDFHMDDYPNGVNAVVAVLSYTGYDMEDAMIINKASFERGFMHGTVYKTEEIDLNPTNRMATRFHSLLTQSVSFFTLSLNYVTVRVW